MELERPKRVDDILAVRERCVGRGLAMRRRSGNTALSMATLINGKHREIVFERGSDRTPESSCSSHAMKQEQTRRTERILCRAPELVAKFHVDSLGTWFNMPSFY